MASAWAWLHAAQAASSQDPSETKMSSRLVYLLVAVAQSSSNKYSFRPEIFSLDLHPHDLL